MKLTKIDLINILAFASLLVIFYPALVVAKEASLMGDHWEQHYPWAFLMAQSLKQGIWPFWTPLIQCGFPIAAESQMGLFYLPNLLLYAALPIQRAYAYLNLFHFYAAAVGTYLYARRIGINSWGAFVAAIVFVFGTGYGGAYYNITSLKTLAWFPWILWTFEMFYGSLQKRYVLLATFFMWLSILAGYLQIAALMMFICVLYLFCRIFLFGETQQTWKSRLKFGGGVLLVFLSSVILAMPQLILTFELSMFSNRIDLTEGYAYVGSLSPFSFLTIVFPKLQELFRGNCLYSGIFPILFVAASFFIASKPLRKMMWLWVLLATISLLLALGQWSPLYVGLIKITRFYSFRIPAKFLIFFLFSFSILAGIGVHVLREDLNEDNVKKRFENRFLTLALAVLTIWGGAYFCLSQGRAWLVSFGEWIVKNYIYGKAGHPRSLESYLDAVRDSINGARGLLSLRDPWQIGAVLLILLSCAWIMFFRRKVRPVILLPVAIFILVADLYVFAGVDIKKDFDSYQHVLRPNAIVEALLAEKDSGKLGRLYGLRTESEWLPLVPSVNMLYGFEDIGGYSPLILRRYYETIGRFGNVNDSNSVQAPEVSYVLNRLPLLNALDVSHVLSKKVLAAPDLHLMLHDLSSDTYLYENTGNRKRAYFVSKVVQFMDWPRLKEKLMSPGFDPQKVLLLENSEKGKLERGLRLTAASEVLKIVRENHTGKSQFWMIETTGPGFFVLPNTLYPGWQAQLNGREVPILKAYGIFQAVYLPTAGKHFLELSYNPYHELGLAFLKG